MKLINKQPWIYAALPAVYFVNKCTNTATNAVYCLSFEYTGFVGTFSDVSTICSCTSVDDLCHAGMMTHKSNCIHTIFGNTLKPPISSSFLYQKEWIICKRKQMLKYLPPLNVKVCSKWDQILFFRDHSFSQGVHCIWK